MAGLELLVEIDKITEPLIKFPFHPVYYRFDDEEGNWFCID